WLPILRAKIHKIFQIYFRYIFFLILLFRKEVCKKISFCELAPRSAFCKFRRQGKFNAAIFVFLIFICIVFHLYILLLFVRWFSIKNASALATQLKQKAFTPSH